MLKVRTTLLLGALVLAPSFVLAAPQTPTPKPKPTPAASASVHSTTGTVKSVDATTLTITRPSGSVKEMTFAINDATKKQGAIAAGASVEVRYKTEGKQNIATAVTVNKKK
jgi:Cu/Ag efflux protein CusF